MQASSENYMEDMVYPSITDSIILCVLIAFFQIVMGISIVIFEIIYKQIDTSDISLIISFLIVLTSMVSVAIVLLIGFKKSERKFNEVFKFNAVSPFLWMAAIVFMIGFVIVMSGLNNLLIHILPVLKLSRNQSNALETLASSKQIFIIAVIFVGILPAFIEEMFFRGLVLGSLNINYSKKKAIIISALLFGIIHLNLLQFLTAFIIGLFAAWICINTNSILLCIYMHLFNNVLFTIIARYQNLIPLEGGNAMNAEIIKFQPLWLDLTGLAIFGLGIYLLKIGFNKAKINA